MSYKPQITGALMEVLTLPKAGVALEQPHIPLLTTSLLPSLGIMQHLRELRPGRAPECSRPPFFCELAGKGFGRRIWQPGSSWGNKKSSYQCKTERPRWLVATQPRWPPLQTHSAGFMVGLRRKGSYSHRPRVVLISRWKCHLLIL